MSVRRLVYLACTACNDQFHSTTGEHYGETAREILERAKAEGWKRSKVQNGSMWDFCPRCWERHLGSP